MVVTIGFRHLVLVAAEVPEGVQRVLEHRYIGLALFINIFTTGVVELVSDILADLCL